MQEQPYQLPVEIDPLIGLSAFLSVIHYILCGGLKWRLLLFFTHGGWEWNLLDKPFACKLECNELWIHWYFINSPSLVCLICTGIEPVSVKINMDAVIMCDWECAWSTVRIILDRFITWTCWWVWMSWVMINWCPRNVVSPLQRKFS